MIALTKPDKSILKKVYDRLLVNSSRVHLLNYNQEFASTIEEGSTVLDAGAGSSPYKSLFAHTKYESADKFNDSCTYCCDINSIPVEDDRFNYILLNQVLEHLPEPKIALNELNRVLKPGGKIIITVPFFYQEHEKPYDFFRYTQFGLRHLLEESGYEIKRLEWLEGYFGTVAYQLKMAQQYLPLSVDSNKNIGQLIYFPLLLICRVAFFLLSAVFYRLDTKFKFTNMGYPKNYVVIAEKK